MSGSPRGKESLEIQVYEWKDGRGILWNKFLLNQRNKRLGNNNLYDGLNKHVLHNKVLTRNYK